MSAYRSRGKSEGARRRKGQKGTRSSSEMVLSLEAMDRKAKKELLALCVGVGFNTLKVPFERELEGKIGEKSRHNPGRKACSSGCGKGTPRMLLCAKGWSPTWRSGVLMRDGPLVVIDGSKALRRTVADVLRNDIPVQGCQVHKMRNVLDHLPEEQRPWVKEKLAAASAEPDSNMARKAL